MNNTLLNRRKKRAPVDASGVMTIGERKESFPVRLRESTFHAVWIGSERGIGVELTTRAGAFS